MLHKEREGSVRRVQSVLLYMCGGFDSRATSASLDICMICVYVRHCLRRRLAVLGNVYRHLSSVKYFCWLLCASSVI